MFWDGRFEKLFLEELLGGEIIEDRTTRTREQKELSKNVFLDFGFNDETKIRIATGCRDENLQVAGFNGCGTHHVVMNHGHHIEMTPVPSHLKDQYLRCYYNITEGIQLRFES